MAGSDSFGAALRRLRVAAGLTQERLAERAGVSAAGVAALEAGRRTAPRLNTVGLLCDALGVDPVQRAALIDLATSGAAPMRSTSSAAPTLTAAEPVEPERAGGAVPPKSRSFVGRDEELRALHEAWRQRTRVALLLGEAGV
ncbi:MAG: helix-turn-helix domain-containing protein, partial [Acidimicrobiales bacterium]|nr:helix-turn-helix domain-containing protein [Acidimicrobiales bacterium]